MRCHATRLAMQSKAKTVTEYLDSLPIDRRIAIEAIREVILANLDPDYEEGIQYGMIAYYVPHRVFPAGYHCDPKLPLNMAGLGQQKNHLALYMMGLYMDPELAQWFQQAWAKTGKKLDMGKACIRFKNLEDVPLDVIGAAFKKLTCKRYLATYTGILEATGRGAKAVAKPAAKQKPAAKASAKPTTKAAAKKR